MTLLRRALRHVQPVLHRARFGRPVGQVISGLSAAINRRLDGAGRHRRLAAALPVVSLALVAIAATNLIGGDGRAAHRLAPAVLALSLGWFGYSLLRTGRVVETGGLPHPSVIASVAAAGWWTTIGSGAVTPECCQPSVSVAGLFSVAGAVVLFIGAERGGAQPAMPGGRLLLTIGALLLAAVAITGATSHAVAESGYPVAYGASLAVIGITFSALAVSEGRLVLRMFRRSQL